MTRQKVLIVVLPGDGIGPEVVKEARKVLDTIVQTRGSKSDFPYEIEFQEHAFGGAAIDLEGHPLPRSTLAACKASSGILFGSVGGPKWNNSPIRPEQGLLELRKELDLYANLRPCRFPSKSLIKYSPLKSEYVEGTDFVVLRELTGGIYYGARTEAGADGIARDEMTYSVGEVERIARIAAQIALAHNPPLPVISIDKANVLATSRLWRKVTTDTFQKEFPQLSLSHQLVDSCAMIMVKNPRSLNGVLLTENMFGDILSDEASIIPGSLGLMPSASLNGWGKGGIGLYEPIHGSAPDIAGQGIANPIGTILSAAMLLRYSLDLEVEANAIERAVEKVLDDVSAGGKGLLTKDLGGKASTSEVGDAVVECLKEELKKL